MNVFSKLLEYGQISIPFNNRARYDCILDYEGRLIRIQIKHASLNKNGSYTIYMRNVRPTKNGYIRKPYNKEQTDYIATIIDGEIYLFNPEYSKYGITVRKDYPISNTKQRINLLKNFHIDKILHENVDEA